MAAVLSQSADILKIKNKYPKEINMTLTLHSGRPQNMDGRLEKEIRTYELLDNLGISYQRVDHEAAETMEACKEISHQINSSRLSFAPKEYMEEYLGLTPGSVSVMGLMNDKENKVQLLVDQDVLDSEYVGCHPCINTSSIRMKTRDVFGKFLEEIHHDFIPVTLST